MEWIEPIAFVEYEKSNSHFTEIPFWVRKKFKTRIKLTSSQVTRSCLLYKEKCDLKDLHNVSLISSNSYNLPKGTCLVDFDITNGFSFHTAISSDDIELSNLVSFLDSINVHVVNLQKDFPELVFTQSKEELFSIGSATNKESLLEKFNNQNIAHSLTVIDNIALAEALKYQDTKFRSLFYKNMSSRAAEMVEDEIQILESNERKSTESLGKVYLSLEYVSSECN